MAAEVSAIPIVVELTYGSGICWHHGNLAASTDCQDQMCCCDVSSLGPFKNH